MRIVFRTEKKRCPDCNKTLKSHRTETRHVISIGACRRFVKPRRVKVWITPDPSTSK